MNVAWTVASTIVSQRVYWLIFLRPSSPPFFAISSSCGKHDRHQLHDDRRVDVRRDAHRDDRELLQRAAREEAEQVIERAALQHALPRRLVDVGQLHVDHEDEPRERKEDEEDPLADLGDEHRRSQVIEHLLSR